jgi:hypothetical protein
MMLRSYRASSFGRSRNRGRNRSRVLQRRCDCGNRAESGGECSQCAESHGLLQRESQAGSEPLDAATRGLMEDRFGRDFSGVRIHRDGNAHNLAGAMNAFAVTNQANIYFAADGYAPATPFGRAILGHELAHVAQNESAGPIAPVSGLESEAERAANAVVEGRHAAIHHGSNQPLLAITRGEQTAAGAGIGAGSLGAVGAGIGLIAASQMRDQPFGLGAAIGGAIGGGLGAGIGALIGYFSRRTSSESTAEAEALIQRRYGRYLRGGATGPLHNASVHVVSAARLCERRQCRSPGAACDLIGWTDTGVPLQPSAGPGNQRPPIPSQAAEPPCPNGEPLEHATPEHPVIYYTRDDSTAGTLIHEGLHAHSHPDFAYLHNHLAEGTTEYFTRRLQDDINMPYISGYDRQVASVERLIGLVGEERLAQAYFTGNVPELHQAVNSQLGRCALIIWAFMLELRSDRAEDVIAGRNQDYCQSPWLVQLGYSPAALTPGESPPPQPQPGAAQPPQPKRQ